MGIWVKYFWKQTWVANLYIFDQQTLYSFSLILCPALQLLSFVTTNLPASRWLSSQHVLPCGCQVGGRNSSSFLVPGNSVGLSDPGPILITGLLEAVCSRALATDLESVDYTCCLAAIIRRMTQHLIMGEVGWLFESSVMGLDGESLIALNENWRTDTISGVT